MFHISALYAEVVHSNGARLKHFEGSMDCTKIQMTRLDWIANNQITCYSVHKRFQCLIYQTINSPDGQIFHMFGLELVRINYMPLYSHINIDAVLKEKLRMKYGSTRYMGTLR